MSNGTKDKFAALGTKIGLFRQEIDPIITNVCYIYSDTLTFNGGKILSHGKVSARYNFDENSCFEIIDKVIVTVKNAIASLILYKGNVAENSESLTRGYQTVIDIANSIDAMASAVIDKLNVDRVQEINDTDKQLQDAEEQKQKALSEIGTVKSLMLPEELFLDKAELVSEYPVEIKIPLAYARVAADENYTSLDIHGKVSSVLEWNLSNSGIVSVSADENSFGSDKFTDFVKCIFYRCLYSYPAAFKRILFCDSLSDERIISFSGMLSDNVQALFLNGKKAILAENSETEIATALTEINDLVSRRLVLLGRTKCKDIPMYNAENQDNVQPLVFVLLHGYPQGYSQSADVLASALKNGRKAGVYFIITANTSAKTADDWSSRKLPEIKFVTDKNYVFSVKNGNGVVTDGKTEYDTDMTGEDFDPAKFLAELKIAVAEGQKSIDFYSILPREDFNTSVRREQFSKVISLPIGKDGAKTLSLNLDSERDSHVIICGTTGSGKSSLINTLVFSAATLYSPKELEINLISMVKSEFDVYGKNKLPHLKTLITKDNIVGAIDVLNYLQDLMQSRMNIVGSDIVSYNASVPKEKRVPRSLIIIDEYQ